MWELGDVPMKIAWNVPMRAAISAARIKPSTRIKRIIGEPWGCRHPSAVLRGHLPAVLVAADVAGSCAAARRHQREVVRRRWREVESGGGATPTLRGIGLSLTVE